MTLPLQRLYSGGVKILLLIPSFAKTGIEEAVQNDRHPRMDYHVLQETLRNQGHDADIVDYSVLQKDTSLNVRALDRVDRDTALASLGFRLCKQYDAVFTNGENVAIPLALLMRMRRRRPGHVTIGHKPSTDKKRVFFQRLHVMRAIDTMFVYSALQQKIVTEEMGIPIEKVPLFAFHADTKFYRPLPETKGNPAQICSAGLEWRDYPTLLRAVADMPALSVRLAAASPWSKHTNETEKMPLPAHVTARRYPYDELRNLYAESAFVVVPLYDNDFQAGVTTLLEAMAMGKAVIITRTLGQTDVVRDGETGLYVPPNDTMALQAAIIKLQENTALREEIGRNARQWAEKCVTIERWADAIAERLVVSANQRR